MPNARIALALGLSACATAVAMPDPSPTPASPPALALDASPPSGRQELAVTALRAQGPGALDRLLAQYDRTAPGRARDDLAQLIDRVAAQRYATTSRLYWYTDLAQAEAVAAKEHKPILALRMLGRLDEDLSCANSRLFRATLYADTEVAALLRSSFILYWSSERPAPRVTIDFGDGRTIQSTTTGNSAHYVLDEHGEVLDVLPGLYAPRAFRTELAASLEHARDITKTPLAEREARLVRYHVGRIGEINRAAQRLSVYKMGAGQIVSPREALDRAQSATMAKAYIEVPQLRQITQAELTELSDRDAAIWAGFAEQLWPGIEKAPLFDARATALIQRLHTGGHATTPEQTAAMLARLREHVLADSALNELRLRREIHGMLSRGVTDFATLNAAIYAEVFHTPASDPWLGLWTRTDFTGLPGDGVTTGKR